MPPTSRAREPRIPLADQAASALLDRVRSGEWELGQKLPGETTLAPELGVGRSTVREAIRQLAGRGILMTRQGSGVFVAAVEPSDERDAALRRADIAAVIEGRIAIEAESAALAAERRTAADLRGIRSALAGRDATRPEVVRAAARDALPMRSVLEAHVDADIVFHRAIVAAAHNPVLNQLFDAFVPRSRQAMVDLLVLRGPGRFGDDADHDVHAVIAQAVADGAATRAATLVRAHLLALRDALS
ncbi:FadR/GntR family transcriptional regulator [Schumannella soli]|uniref:FadR family transcriptional regulator n=1 Tax=Schumannella soli TaxID=2590779 RepID=A0A506Y942_9MICO|nr:GntR family transcriptional regulator [Schumannella soli]TPW78010.1 FadR family transcriptional regulator [Schumannella soli]